MPHTTSILPAYASKLLPSESIFAPNIDSNVTYGLAIVGEAQAGKGTIRAMVEELWPSYDPAGAAYAFPASNAYRGLAANILAVRGMHFDKEVTELEKFNLEGFLSPHQYKQDMPAILDSTFDRPPAPEIMRSTAVTSVVAHVGKHPDVRALANEAGLRHLRRIMRRPADETGKRTSLIIMDARNSDECQAKFTKAGIRQLGTLVLTCPPWVAAKRGFEAGKFNAEDIPKQIAQLTQRNAYDREREVQPMTLPEDFNLTFPVHRLYREEPNDAGRLGYVGRFVAENPGSALVMATDQMNLSNEKNALRLLMTGMLATRFNV